MERLEIGSARCRQADRDRFSPLHRIGAAGEPVMFWLIVSIVGAYMLMECAAELTSGEGRASTSRA